MGPKCFDLFISLIIRTFFFSFVSFRLVFKCCGLILFVKPGEKDDLHAELWHACAGPSVCVPRAGEKVLYFPQGHIEQV